ncbi:MAG: hypothetical protein AAGK04_06440 [Planctomycetota bacterium]
MIVAFDIDDTITRCPEFFGLVARALRAEHHRVVIITFREDRAATEADLRAWNIPYDELITSSLDEHLEHGVDEWKGVVCQRLGVDVFFEDDPNVLKHISPNVVVFQPKSNRERLND